MDRSNSKTGLKIPLAPKWHSINWWNVVKETSYIIDHMKQMSFLCYFEKISRIPSKKTFTLSTKFWKKKSKFWNISPNEKIVVSKLWCLLKQNHFWKWTVIFESGRSFLKVEGHFWKWTAQKQFLFERHQKTTKPNCLHSRPSTFRSSRNLNVHVIYAFRKNQYQWCQIICTAICTASKSAK